ncbi:hypothetical protein POAR111328_00500 [Polynucleobacter arcticus]
MKYAIPKLPYALGALASYTSKETLVKYIRAIKLSS